MKKGEFIMNPILISVIISGSISLIGIVINLFIAKEQRRSELTKLKISSSLKFKEINITELNKYCTETEKLRIACWNLKIYLQNLYDDCSSCNLDKIKDSPDNEFRRNKDNLLKQFEVFFKSWATIKGSFQSDDILRTIRHSAKTYCASIDSTLDNFERNLSKETKYDISSLKERIARINGEIEELLRLLDNIFSYVNNFRNNMILDLIGIK
jgi:hypothetical protein